MTIHSKVTIRVYNKMKLLSFVGWWLVYEVVVCANLWFWWTTSSRHPDRVHEFKKFALGFVIWANIPLIVMAIGMTTGRVPSGWHYMRPQDSNPYVLALYGSGFLMWILGFYWVFYHGGAEKLSRNLSLRTEILSSTTYVKILYILTLIGMICGIIFVVVLDLPIRGG